MGTNPPSDEPAPSAIVGPFTGFGNFLMKECRDWWNSWRLIIIFAIPTLILTLMVFFGFTEVLSAMERMNAAGQQTQTREDIATRMVLGFMMDHGLTILMIFIMIFSTMGILTAEKSTGTLAWNLTKPLGRTGLFVAKWLVATLAIWVAMCVVPSLIAAICMTSYHHITPQYAKMVPVIAASFTWIGLWVLLVLAISLGFQSQGAVGGIMIAFWAVPNLLGLLMGEVLGKETRDWILDRLATNAPFFMPQIVADRSLFHFFERPEWKNVWLWSFGVWVVFLWVISLRIFNRQEVGS
jgi:ABC-type transport system involved in multi-copper enzyme maturation permease subunit